MVQLAPTVAAYAQTLANITLDVSAVDRLHEIACGLPALVRQLRGGSCNEVMTMLEQAVKNLWEVLHPGASKLAKAHLASISSLLQECCSLFPLQSGFHEALEACGKVQKESGQQELLQALLTAVEKVTHAKQKEHAIQAIKDLAEFLRSTKIVAQQVPDDAKAVLNTAIMSVAEILDKYWEMKDGMPDFIVLCTEISKVLAGIVNISVVSKAVTLVEDGVSMVQGFIDLNCIISKEGASRDETLQSVLVLRRRLTKYNKSKALLTEDTKMAVLQKFIAFRADVTALFSEQKGLLISGAESKLQTEQKNLMKMAGGAKNGCEWLESFSGSTWENLLQHASTTIATIKPTDLVEAQKALQEAFANTDTPQVWVLTRKLLPEEPLPIVFSWSWGMQRVLSQALAKYEHYVKAFDEASKPELIEAINELLQKSHITKCTGVCLHWLSQAGSLSKEQLRGKIQAEVQALKNKTGSFDAFLHPLLVQKINLALAMRF
eukprot:2177790-Amphidinium_carterae.2